MQKLLTTTAILYLFVMGDASAAGGSVTVSGVNFEVSCNTRYSGFNYAPGDHIGESRAHRGTSQFLDDAWAQRFSQDVSGAIESACGGRSKSGRVAIRFLSSWFEALCIPGGTCQVTRNGAKIEAAAKAQQLKEQEARNARQRQIEATRDAEANVAAAKAQTLSDRHKASWIPWDKVRANPFAFQDKVFLLNTAFNRMITADTAVFGAGFGTNVIVSGVPRTAFTEAKPVIVVGQMLDSDPSKNPPGITGTQIRLKYLAHEFCARNDCSDFGKVRGR